MKKLEFNLKTVLVELIAQSNDSEKFEILEGLNRGINEQHVKELEESFTEFGTASVMIKVVKTKAFGKIKYFVADGQHSRKACNNLKLPLNVTIVTLEVDTKLNLMKYISVLNNTSKGWENSQYMESFANCDVKPYQTMQKFAKDSKKILKMTDLHCIFLENDYKMIRKYKKGELIELPNETNNVELFKAVMKVINLVPKKAYVRRSLYKSMRLSSDYDIFANEIIEAAKLMQKAETKFSENEHEFFTHLERIRKVASKKMQVA